MNNQTSTLWGHIATERVSGNQIHGWLDSPLVQRGYVQPLTGLHFTSGAENWLSTLVKQHAIPPTTRWLSLGCGNGGWEMFAASTGLAASIEGLDIAVDAIALAQRTAQESGITNASFRVVDVNTERLPERAYDVILCSMALHHVERLEFFLAEAAQALRPGGWLIINEYIGPSRWQWSDRQLAIINTLLQALPPRYRVHALTGRIKEREERPSIEFMKHLDPSESVRAAEIVPLVGSSFEILERRDYGGAILHKLLEYIVGNFSEHHSEDIELLGMLFGFEQALMRANVVESDFAVIVARNTRTGLRGPTLPLDSQRERYVVSGCYAIETATRGKPFFWTSADAELVLARPPDATALHMHLMLPPVPSCVTVYLDDRPIGCLQMRDHTSPRIWRHVAFGLPPTACEQPSIRIQCQPAWSPAEQGYPQDTRMLGVAISRMWYA